MKQNNKKIIWLTGGSGSGKSTASKILSNMGFTIIDADKIAGRLLDKNTPAYNEVINSFGGNIKNNDESINRKKLADIVFTDNEKLEILNNIMHKYIKKEILNSLSNDKKYIIDAPLINTYGIKCDMTVVITAPYDVRIKRIIKRDGLTLEQAKNRIASQESDDKYCENADCIIINDKDETDLYNKISRSIIVE